MDPSSGHDHQEMRVDDQSLESILTGGAKVQQDMVSKQTKPQPEQALKCPRCDSTNTKFCYYNNYSLSQPRYFCKSCRRYWTKGGTLRNVPVGGGCRKNKRTSSSSSKRNIIITHQDNPNPLLTNFYDSNSSDLHLPLAFAHLQKLSNGNFGNYQPDHLAMDHHHHHQGFLETQGLNHMQNLYYGFADGSSVGEVSSTGVSHNHQDQMMFPCEDVKQEACSSRENDSRFLLGNFPWQIGGDGGVNNHLGEFGSSMRGSWNNGINIGSSNWQGLLNSPLM